MQDSEELLEIYLEADQISAEAERPVPPAPLSRRLVWSLWVLRVFCVVVGVMVIYVFVSQLGG